MAVRMAVMSCALRESDAAYSELAEARAAQQERHVHTEAATDSREAAQPLTQLGHVGATQDPPPPRLPHWNGSSVRSLADDVHSQVMTSRVEQAEERAAAAERAGAELAADLRAELRAAVARAERAEAAMVLEAGAGAEADGRPPT